MDVLSELLRHSVPNVHALPHVLVGRHPHIVEAWWLVHRSGLCWWHLLLHLVVREIHVSHHEVLVPLHGTNHAHVLLI